MRVVLESLRFVIIFSLLWTMIGAITHLTLLSLGVIVEPYIWIAFVGVLIFMFALYRNRGWGIFFNKKILCTSVILIILFVLFIPDSSPAHLHTTKYVYSYGFPFQFLTLYVENGNEFVISNLFSGGITAWDLSMGVFGNFILFYFTLHFIRKKLSNGLVNKKSESTSDIH
ncbi:hypothetical protein NC661_21110 [Aquibacillus koreensis]|uniref:Uncharacterized protein n=1 Tax=Aquibacillus koreensis TaxID=279446 RepID=A0A9X4AK94_9BACI|nr:hypothetical protein [Aquibacillus koreensis]MCT2535312.1 hypothetical protein [Aquibacillus koreensis]MDC3422846.1 hypothetical protein [Aquibacillus koreensis]